MLSRRRMIAALPALGAPSAFAGSARAQTGVGGPLVGRFEITANRPWTYVSIGGEGPFRFLIDTGASTSLIDPALARGLGLPRLEDAELQGATAQRPVAMYAGRDVIVAETLRQRGQVVFAAGEAGADFQGVLPGAIFTAADTVIDFAAREFRIFTAGVPDRSGFMRLPLVRSADKAGRMVVNVRLDGQPAKLLIDTGGAGSVLLSGEYVGRHRLWDRYARWAPGEGQGVMTSFNLRLVRARDLRLGDTVLEHPIVHLTDPFNPPGDGGDGVIGMDVLRRFTLSTDPAGAALWIKPNASLREPFRYDRAGLEARLRQDGCVVTRLTPQSPAARAGILVGDRLPAIADARDLARFDWFLSEAAGTKVAFDIERDGVRRPVSLVLEELL